MERVSIKIDKATHTKLKKICKAKGMTMVFVLSKAVMNYLIARKLLRKNGTINI